MNHNLNGKRYDVVYVDKIPDDDEGLLCGLCDSPTIKDKKIHIRNGLPPQMLIDTLVHESIHACLWCLSEDTVEQVATDITNLLVKELDITYEQ